MNTFDWKQLFDVITAYPASQLVLLAISIFSVMVMLLMWKAYRRQQKLQKAQMNSMRILQQDVKALVNAAVGVGEHVMNLERRQRELSAAQSSTSIQLSKQVQSQVHKQPQKQNQKQKPAKQEAAPAAVSMPVRMQSYDYSDQAYEQAIKMVKNGADIREVARYCGLSRSEAELIAMMHRYDRNPQAIH